MVEKLSFGCVNRITNEKSVVRKNAPEAEYGKCRGSGNVSLNQELTFIQAVNGWVREDKERTGFAKIHKEIDIYMIAMAKQLSESLDLGSKFNRDPAFVSDVRQHGDERAAEFLDFWSTAAEHELDIIKWPTRALEES